MGLSGAKNKTKLSHDPNNTAWSRSTTGFGHKILASQGWKPGDYLGAENASHSDHYTAANASHIRVMLREENLGIGAQVGKGNAETFGLSMFSGLLGRLNGKSDVEVEKQQSALRDVQLSTFQAQRYGFMNFVSGGLLVGDKMEFPKSTVMADKPAADPGRKDLKRKAEQEAREQPQSKKKKKAIVEADSQSSEDDSDDNEVAAPAKKEKKRKSKDEQNDIVSTKAAAKELRRREKAERKVAREARKASKSGADSGEKARLKAERKARKEERRQRKEEKRRRRAAKTAPNAQPSTTQTSASSSDSDGTATPPVSGGFAGGRHAVRQRYIQQKRMASMDPQALKEIFMLQQPKAAS